MSKVEKGQLIAEYWKLKESSMLRTVRPGEAEEIRATSSGMLFQFRDNNTYYGVIAHESDNKGSIKAWVKANRR